MPARVAAAVQQDDGDDRERDDEGPLGQEAGREHRGEHVEREQAEADAELRAEQGGSTSAVCRESQSSASTISTASTRNGTGAGSSASSARTT